MSPGTPSCTVRSVLHPGTGSTLALCPPPAPQCPTDGQDTSGQQVLVCSFQVEHHYGHESWLIALGIYLDLTQNRVTHGDMV